MATLSEDAIFDVARQISSQAARDAYLDQACDRDKELRARLVELLTAHDAADSRLDSPLLQPTAEHVEPLPLENPGTQIGPYKLLQVIGEGGMGVVYMAEQKKPVKRRVALKIIKPGMDTRQVIARFEAERQALAMMDHPNIARVFEAGTTENGRPYFVMELVKGIPITEFCDQKKLTARERLSLFVDVCQAVHHAHQRGIIHRDLKPSNVLVALFDEKPSVKVIDFGVAKTINHELTERTMFTQFGQIVGTLEYMSPEQAQLNQLDVDTRSDIYSLGVLLYELLTGQTPFDRQRLQEAAFDEVLRIIREEEPPKPSVRVSTSPTLSMIAASRGTEPVKLSKLVRGELDWIVMKSLEKNRSRRYETATDLAKDITNHLNDAPVVACPPAKAYLFRKFVRRHRGPVFAAALVAFAMLMGTLTILVALVETRRAHAVAIASAKVADQETANAWDRLKRLQSEIIERALLCAVAGDIDGVDEALRRARQADISESWILTLEGAALLHRGDNREALHRLEEARAMDRQNVSAAAMLAVAHVHDGNWNEYCVVMTDLRHASPREEYEAFDALFLGYARIYDDCRLAADELRSLLRHHPSWIVPRAFLGIAEGHAAADSGDLDMARSAMTQLLVAELAAEDNPVVLMSSLFAHSVAIEICQRDQQDASVLLDEADKLAVKLERFPDYAPANIIRANYYDRFGDPQKARLAFEDVSTSARGNLASPAIAYWLRIGEPDKSLQTIQGMNGDSLETKIARAYVLADDPARRTEALSLYESIVNEYPTLYARASAISILCLLGEMDKVQKDCRNWLQASTAEYASPCDMWALQFLAGEIDKPIELASDPPWWWEFFSEYMIALRALGCGRRQEAIEHFQASVNTTKNGPSEHAWAMAFLERLRRDPAWPRGHNKETQATVK